MCARIISISIDISHGFNTTAQNSTAKCRNTNSKLYPPSRLETQGRHTNYNVQNRGFVHHTRSTRSHRYSECQCRYIELRESKGYTPQSYPGVASLFPLMGQYKKLQSFYLNVCANQKWGIQNEWAKPFYIQELATTLCSIQLNFQDIGLVDHSVIDLVNTLVNKWNPQVLQQSNTSALLSLNLLYNYNIDMAAVCALQVLVNHFAVDVHTTISCDAYDSPHLYSDDD